MGVIYITHRLDELQAVGDRVTILRDGETVHTSQLAELTTDRIIQHMVGRRGLDHLPARFAARRATNCCAWSTLRGRASLSDISFSLRAGEIVGMAGLIGAGRTELCRALFGVDPIDSGKVFVRGREVRIRSPQEAVAAGLALVTGGPADHRPGPAAAYCAQHHAGQRGRHQPFRFSRLATRKTPRPWSFIGAAAHPRRLSPPVVSGG